MSRRPQRRHYYYWVNHYGQLYVLDDAAHQPMPYGPTYLKDAKFLDFFFRQLQRAPRDPPGSRTDAFPWLSRCGIEYNWVRASRTPIVFSLLRDGLLSYAGTLSVPFEPDGLVLQNGELYHPDPLGELSLVHTHVATELFAHFDEAGTVFRWNGREHRVRTKN